jgi:hypothetical protein
VTIPTPKDVAFRVLEESWDKDTSVRTIWRFEMVVPVEEQR